jgi:predicted DNA-binding WGR domain protein
MNETEVILNEFGKDRTDAIKQVLAQNRINASGRLSNSVIYETKSKGFIFQLEISAFSYIFSALQEGRGPTENDGPGDLRIRISEWVEDKKIKFDTKAERERFIFFTTRKIHKEGTRLYRRFGKFGRTTGELEKIFSDQEIDQLEEELIRMSEAKTTAFFTQFSTFE